MGVDWLPKRVAPDEEIQCDRRENIPFRDDPGRKKMPKKMEKLAKIFGRFFCVFFEFLLGRRWWAVVFFLEKKAKKIIARRRFLPSSGRFGNPFRV